MVNVGNKIIHQRVAVAEGKIFLNPTTIELIKQKKIIKGEVLNTSKIAGIQASKFTSKLIPLCHPLILDYVELNFKIGKNKVTATSIVQCTGRTGVEIEALTAVSIALLTIYDMCKAVDKKMKITEIKLISKVKNIIK